MSKTSADDALRTAAFAAMAHAYAPYSKHRVGAAIRADNGSVVQGCNVENAAYPLGVCAEQAAAAAAVALGSRRFLGLAIATEGDDPSPPCGACRQFLAEFGDVPITSYSSQGRAAHWLLSELLPHAFTGAMLPENGQ